MTTTTISRDSIPHRAPFAFVDEIVEVHNDRIKTRTLAKPEADFFRGHYPHFPIMPGVLVCESCFQAGALLLVHRLGASAAEGVPVVTRISDARFKRMVRPGQTLDVEVSLDEELDGAFYMTGRAQVNGQLAARVSFVCMRTDPATGDA